MAEGDRLQALFTSRARAEVLRALVFDPGREFGIRELDRCLGADYRAVRQELRRLHRAGFLACRPEGRSLRYRIDLARPDGVSLAALVIAASGVLERLTEHLAEHGIAGGWLVIERGQVQAYGLKLADATMLAPLPAGDPRLLGLALAPATRTAAVAGTVWLPLGNPPDRPAVALAAPPAAPAPVERASAAGRRPVFDPVVD